MKKERETFLVFPSHFFVFLSFFLLFICRFLSYFLSLLPFFFSVYLIKMTNYFRLFLALLRLYLIFIFSLIYFFFSIIPCLFCICFSLLFYRSGSTAKSSHLYFILTLFLSRSLLSLFTQPSLLLLSFFNSCIFSPFYIFWHV